MTGTAPLSRLAGWLAILAMAANLCVGMAAARVAIEPPANAPACCCGDACECGSGCACSVAPADPAERLPETPATVAVTIKLVPLAIPAERTPAIALVPVLASTSLPPRASPGWTAGQRETRLRTGICTT